MLIWLAHTVVEAIQLREFEQFGLAVAKLEPGLDATADHSLRWNAVGFFRIAANEFDSHHPRR